MNIYIQNKTAREAGILDKVKEPLDPGVNELFCWNVSVVKLPDETQEIKNVMIIKNAFTEFSILVPNVELNQDLFKLIETYIKKVLNQLRLNKEVVENYFNEAGEFKFGLIKKSSIGTNLRNNALKAVSEYYRRNLLSHSKDKIGALAFTHIFNNRKHYRNYTRTYSQLMKHALNDLFFMPKNLTNDTEEGIKAYEFLAILDVGIYEVTRRLIVPANLTFYDLHEILIEVFDWWDYHLACFDLLGTHLELLPDGEMDYELMEDYTLEELVESAKYFYWTYDYGDDWEHEIELLNVYDNYQEDEPYLLEAHHNAPPEDVGGVGGFQEFLEILRNPNDPEYETYKEWGGSWTPELSEEMKKPHIIKYSKKDE